MDLLTREDLVEIARPTDGGTHVSLFLPTHRAGNQVEADRLRFKNMITRVEEALAGRERRPDIDRLLSPAWELHDDALEWRYMSDGLAMFLGPGGSRAFRVPAPMSALATVGDRPDRLEVAGRGDREPGLDGVDAQPRELERDLHLLALVQARAGALLAVAQRRVEDDKPFGHMV